MRGTTGWSRSEMRGLRPPDPTTTLSHTSALERRMTWLSTDRPYARAMGCDSRSCSTPTTASTPPCAMSLLHAPVPISPAGTLHRLSTACMASCAALRPPSWLMSCICRHCTSGDQSQSRSARHSRGRVSSLPASTRSSAQMPALSGADSWLVSPASSCGMMAGLVSIITWRLASKVDAMAVRMPAALTMSAGFCVAITFTLASTTPSLMHSCRFSSATLLFGKIVCQMNSPACVRLMVGSGLSPALPLVSLMSPLQNSCSLGRF
mmetsp:Transcript_28223/g.71966  ORF Transcript_28223/g.71966 Transcript_28223/m.71966 type:complete len:265 (+) Transcript_28223:19-813(+)